MFYTNGQQQTTPVWYQGIIVSTYGMEPKLVKSFWELQSMPVRCHKKSPLVFFLCL